MIIGLIFKILLLYLAYWLSCHIEFDWDALFQEIEISRVEARRARIRSITYDHHRYVHCSLGFQKRIYRYRYLGQQTPQTELESLREYMKLLRSYEREDRRWRVNSDRAGQEAHFKRKSERFLMFECDALSRLRRAKLKRAELVGTLEKLLAPVFKSRRPKEPEPEVIEAVVKPQKKVSFKEPVSEVFQPKRKKKLFGCLPWRFSLRRKKRNRH